MKKFTRNRVRRLTRAQKILTSNAGLNPKEWLYAGENDLYVFLVSKRNEDRVSVRKI